jgi:membrane protein DedA with SNARE-associated domain
MDFSLENIISLFEKYSFWIVFFGMIAENALFLGIIVPGISLLVISGYLMFSGGIDGTGLFLAAFFGTLIGDNINFLMGYYGANRFPWVKRVLDSNPEVTRFLHRSPKAAYIFFHFPLYLRTIFPLLLGTTKFPLRQWVVVDLVATPLFVTTFIGLGYILGSFSESLQDIVNYGNTLAYFFGLLFIGWTVRLVARLYRSFVPKKK